MSFPNPEVTRLGQLAAAAAEIQAGDSGVLRVENGKDAFVSRIVLADAAERSIDAQYYIWRPDQTGQQLAYRLLAAADRGVRVRLLLDDYGVDQKGNSVFSLDAHANIEVRVYNPVSISLRSVLTGDLRLRDLFSRLNRRMHSKTFIVDDSVAISGGRNVGDEYFDAGRDLNFIDRELLVVGPVVAEVAGQFDVMWNSEWSIPASALSDSVPSDAQVHANYAELIAFANAVENMPYDFNSAPADQLAQFSVWLADMIWAPVDFAYNSPELTGGNEDPENSVARKLRGLMRQAKQELLIESSYFVVPDDDLVNLDQLLGRGLTVKVLTNSLASTDVWTIHSGYTKNRPALIERGVELHEFRSDAASCPQLIANPALNCDEFKFSLHNKAVVLDRKIVYIGSFNLNPRSELVNTETALIVYSAELAQHVAASMRFNMNPENSWQVVLDSTSALQWRGKSNEQLLLKDDEPDTGFFLRIASRIYSVLAVDKYL